MYIFVPYILPNRLQKGIIVNIVKLRETNKGSFYTQFNWHL